MCYIETSSLDGEKNLKKRTLPPDYVIPYKRLNKNEFPPTLTNLADF